MKSFCVVSYKIISYMLVAMVPAYLFRILVISWENMKI